MAYTSLVERLARKASKCHVSSKKLYDLVEVAWKTNSIEKLREFIKVEVSRGTISPDFAIDLENSIEKINDIEIIREILKEIGKLKDFYYIEPLYNNLETIKQIIGATTIFRFEVIPEYRGVTIYIYVDRVRNKYWARRKIYEKFFKGDNVNIIIDVVR